MGTLGAVRFSPFSGIVRIVEDRLQPTGHVSMKAPGVEGLGTLSECLFFFGIQSFHYGERRKASWSFNFWRRQRHTLLPSTKKKAKDKNLAPLTCVLKIPCPGIIKSPSTPLELPPNVHFQASGYPTPSSLPLSHAFHAMRTLVPFPLTDLIECCVRPYYREYT